MRILSLYSAYAGRVVAALTTVVALSVFLYGILLFGAMAHAAGLTAAEREVRELSASVSVLEGEYLTATKALSPERAAALGFVAPQHIATVYAEKPTLTLGNE